MYNVSISPHVRDKSSTQKIMRDVAIALIPTLGFGVYKFGLNALMLILVSVASCVIFEAGYEYLTKKPITVFDFSAVVTGMIIAVNLPPTATWWMAVLGSAFAIIVTKMLFGGLGQNFMNPALAGRCFLMISFTQRMTNFAVDGLSSATPLAAIRNGETVDLLTLAIGNHGGCIGEISSLAILIGAAYLLIRKVISPRIPFIYIISTVVIIAIIRLIQGADLDFTYLLMQALSGGLLVGAFFMATDYVTSPITARGQVIYALVLGLLTALFRTLGSTAEGVSYSIIIGNVLVPLIERVTVPLPFGIERKIKKLTKEGKENG